MSCSGREALSNVLEWLRGHPECPGVVGRPSLMSGRVGMPSRMSGSCQKALPNVLVWSGGLPGCPEVVGRPSRMSGRSRETLPNVWSAFPDVQEWSGGPL